MSVGVGMWSMFMSMAGITAGISPTFGMERCLDGAKLRPQPFQHQAQHRIIDQPQAPIVDHLRRRVPVADMPGKACQMQRITGRRFQQ